MHKTIVALLALGLSGCTLAPRYERPVAPVALKWPASASEATPTTGQPAQAVADIEWYEFFSDARLRAVIALAIENNRDLRVATLTMARNRALYRVQRADLLPTINASGSSIRQRIPFDLSTDGVAETASADSIGIGVTAYELDLFGRVQSLRNEALEQFLASEETQKSARLALIGAVANQYVAERAYDEQRAIAQQTLESVLSSFALIRQRYEAGNASELDLRTAETQVQTSRANLDNDIQAHEQALNSLVLLIGCSLPSSLPPPESLASHRLIDELPAGLPSDLLFRRPDILAAEHTLKAANAAIGAARAAFFPSIQLTAFGGSAGSDLNRLFNAGSGVWSFAPQITLPIFSGGRNRANLDAAKIGKLIEIAQYEKTIQVAFREVADELVAHRTAGDILLAQTARVHAEEQRFALSSQRYQQGVDSYIVLLTAQRDLYDARQLLVQAQQAKLANLINLYKALGGGWRDHDTAPTVALAIE